MHLQDRLIRYLQYTLQTSLQDVLQRCLSDLHLRHLLDICRMSWQDVLLALIRHLSPLRHLADIFLLLGMVTKWKSLPIIFYLIDKNNA